MEVDGRNVNAAPAAAAASPGRVEVWFLSVLPSCCGPEVRQFCGMCGKRVLKKKQSTQTSDAVRGARFNVH